MKRTDELKHRFGSKHNSFPLHSFEVMGCEWVFLSKQTQPSGSMMKSATCNSRVLLSLFSCIHKAEELGRDFQSSGAKYFKFLPQLHLLIDVWMFKELENIPTNQSSTIFYKISTYKDNVNKL